MIDSYIPLIFQGDPSDDEEKMIHDIMRTTLIGQDYKIEKIFLSMSFNICFGCSKEPSQ